jgi:hypothetical protein
MAKKLAPRELPFKLNGIPLNYLECYDKLHAWDDYTYTIVRNKRTRRQQIRRVLMCSRCESLRVEMLSIASGDRLSKPIYHHSEGYKLAKGEAMTAADRAAIRLYRAPKTITEED